jgi:hypothetical protein
LYRLRACVSRRANSSSEAEIPLPALLYLVKRVHIPGYEQTRELFRETIRAGAIAPLIGKGFYTQSEIQKMHNWALMAVSSSMDCD